MSIVYENLKKQKFDAKYKHIFAVSEYSCQKAAMHLFCVYSRIKLLSNYKEIHNSLLKYS